MHIISQNIRMLSINDATPKLLQICSLVIGVLIEFFFPLTNDVHLKLNLIYI